MPGQVRARPVAVLECLALALCFASVPAQGWAASRERAAAPLARPPVRTARLEPDGSQGGSALRRERPPSAAVPLQGPVASLVFDGIGRLDESWPADPTGAVSSTWFVTAVNSAVAVYERTGARVLGPLAFASIFDVPAGTQVFDPRVVFDPYAETFVLSFLGVNDGLRKSWILVVTMPDATASDLATWCGTRIGGDRTRSDGRQWPDYPGLGFDVDRVTISTNQFDFRDGTFAWAQILSLPKTSLYDCSAALQVDTFAGRDTRNADGTQASTLLPAISAGVEPASQYLVSFDPGKPAHLVLWRISSSDVTPELKRTAIQVHRAKLAPYATQCGGSLTRADSWWDPGDLRIVTVFYDADAGRVYAAHTVAKDLTPDPITGHYVESAIRWYDVSAPSKLKTATLMRTGVIGAPETDAGWPALATDGSGNLLVTYSRASAPAGECLSAWAAEVPPGSTSASSTLLVPGQARLEAIPGPERWGDFNAASRDPSNPGVVAVVNQYARSAGAGPTKDWQQTVALVSAG